MIEFHQPTLADKEWVDRCLEAGEHRGCEYSFAGMLGWGPAYGREIAQWEGWFLSRSRGKGGHAYLWPAGAGEAGRALEAIEADAKALGEPVRFICLTQAQAGELEALRPGQFEIEEDRDNFDYLYEVDKLSDLAGRKLHSKRNHCKRFEENNPDWVYEDLTEEAVPECMEVDALWEERSREREGAAEAQDITNEKRAMVTTLKNFTALRAEGGLIRVEGRVVAFTIGSPICADTFDVHFEKAFGEIQGAYAMINREFARRLRQRHPELRYLNREEDMGLEGLRKAKESYYPDLLLEKFTAVQR